MLDLKFVRENPQIIKKDLEKRNDARISWVDDILELDNRYRTLLQETQGLRKKRNELSEQINKIKKEKGEASDLLNEAKAIPAELERKEQEVEACLDAINMKLMRLPNILHDSVPVGKDDSENEVLEHIGEKPEFTFTPKDHETLARKWDLIDLERSAKIAGARFFALKGELVQLEQALILYALSFLEKKGFTQMSVPQMMNRKAYEGVTDLEDFETVMYNVQPDDLYLIATSEHPLTAMYMDEVLETTQLPIQLAGISTNYRREVGTHGKEDKGIWRVHQFNKVEQVIFCKPDQSWEWHERLLENAKEFFKSLGVHFRVVNICTGDIGTVAAKKYDLEAWIPSANKYKEIVSCSNCTAYQATRLKIRYRAQEGNHPLHTLNSTCVATTRALVAIIEQFQQSDGSILIPKPLQLYMGGKTRIGHI